MKRKSKIITIAAPIIVILVSCVVYQYGILNIHSEAESIKESQELKMKMLQKYADAIAQKKDLEKRLQLLKEMRKDDTVKIIAAKTPALAAATLQNTIKGIIVGKGGTINSERAEKPEELGNFKIVNVVTDVIFPDTRALSDTLYALETQTPYLVVKELDIRVRNYNAPKDLIIKLKIAAITGA